MEYRTEIVTVEWEGTYYKVIVLWALVNTGIGEYEFWGDKKTDMKIEPEIFNFETMPELPEGTDNEEFITNLYEKCNFNFE